MIDVDLELFVTTAEFGPFNQDSTREQIRQLLGPEDESGYVDFATYGHVSFDLCGGNGPPCRTQISFPHSSHMKPADPAWSDWKMPTCFDHWPDKRFKWNLGRFQPQVTVDELLPHLQDFEIAEMLGRQNKDFAMYINPSSNIYLLFKTEKTDGDLTLYLIVSHPVPVNT